MPELALKWMTIDDLDRIGEIDRTEKIDTRYLQSGREIAPRSTKSFVGGCWPGLQTTVEFYRGHKRAGAEALGAFDGDTLVGIAMLAPDNSVTAKYM